MPRQACGIFSFQVRHFRMLFALREAQVKCSRDGTASTASAIFAHATGNLDLAPNPFTTIAGCISQTVDYLPKRVNRNYLW
jgi:hypothetical protein